MPETTLKELWTWRSTNRVLELLQYLPKALVASRLSKNGGTSAASSANRPILATLQPISFHRSSIMYSAANGTGLTSSKHRSTRLEWPWWYQEAGIKDRARCLRTPGRRTANVYPRAKFTRVFSPKLRSPPRSRELKAHEYGKNANPRPRRVCTGSVFTRESA